MILRESWILASRLLDATGLERRKVHPKTQVPKTGTWGTLAIRRRRYSESNIAIVSSLREVDMRMLSKRSLMIVVLAGLTFTSSAAGQTALKWNLITDNILASVDLDNESPTGLGAMDFVDGNTGFIMTGLEVIRTEDGGNSWKVLEGDNSGHFHFVDRDFWIALPIGGGTRWGITHDGGKRWESVDHKQCPDVVPFFLNDAVAWGTSLFSICTTNDGGQAWRVVVDHPEGVKDLSPVFMLDNTHGWVVGDHRILATSDGSHWVTQFQDALLAPLEMHFFDRNNGFLKIRVPGVKVGAYHGQAFLYSTDGGRHWQPSTWNGLASDRAPGLFSNSATRGTQDIWVVGYLNPRREPGQGIMETQYDFVLFHSGNGGASFQSAGKLPNNTSQPRSLAVSNQQGKPVLLLLDSNGALWRAFLPAN